MDKICKQYISNIRFLFPQYGRKEKRYLKKYERLITDYCAEHTVSSIQQLYEEFGTPDEVIHTYYREAGIDYIIQRIKRTRLVRFVLIALLVLSFIATISYCGLLYSEYQSMKHDEVFYERTIID